MKTERICDIHYSSERPVILSEKQLSHWIKDRLLSSCLSVLVYLLHTQNQHFNIVNILIFKHFERGQDLRRDYLDLSDYVCNFKCVYIYIYFCLRKVK